MDTGFTIRPASGTSQFGLARDETIQLPKAEPTELGPAKAVLATDPSSKTEALPGSAQRRADSTVFGSANPNIDTQVVIDTESGDVVFRMVDVFSKRVIHQIPDHALLRLRAYSRAINNGESVAAAMSKTDLET